MASISAVRLSDEEAKRVKNAYPPECPEVAMIRSVPGNYVYPESFLEYKDQFKGWHVRQDDTYVLGFPKTGTTWTQELVWCIQNGFDVEKAKSVTWALRTPWLEAPLLFHVIKDIVPVVESKYLESLENMASPRVFKSHLPLCLLPDNLLEKSKSVICLRNPKDTLVSFYYHQKLMNPVRFIDNFPTYFDLFMANLTYYSPYFNFVAQLWEKRKHPNVCVLFYEEMKADLVGSVRKIAKFLEKEITDEQMEILLDHLSFNKMKVNPSVIMKKRGKEGHFFRKGQIGDWKNHFTDDMNKRMDEAIGKYLKPIGLEFFYE